jgi:integrase
MKGIKEPRGRIRNLQFDERQRRLHAPTTPPYLWTIVLVAVSTGLRRGNIVELRWEQIDSEPRIITIPGIKTDEPLVVPPNRSTLAALKGIARTDAVPLPRRRSTIWRAP